MASIIPPTGRADRPTLRPKRRRLSKRDRIGLLFALVIITIGLVANLFWSDRLIPIPVVAVALIILAPVELPHVAFGSVATIIYVLGCYLRWPTTMARLSPVRRGLILLAVVFLLHGMWLQFGWVPFRPLCTSGGGPFTLYSSRSLAGPMTPEAASRFVDILQRQYNEDAARLSGSDHVLVRPPIALFDSELHWNYTSRIAESFGGARASDSCKSVEEAIMAGGKASYWGLGWGILAMEHS